MIEQFIHRQVAREAQLARRTERAVRAATDLRRDTQARATRINPQDHRLDALHVCGDENHLGGAIELRVVPLRQREPVQGDVLGELRAPFFRERGETLPRHDLPNPGGLVP